MSFFSSNKDKDPLNKKSQFYVEFLGWMECRGVRGQRYTDPIIRELRRRQKRVERPPKFTIQVTRKELRITQELEEKKKRSIQKIKFPTIPARDVTYVVQARRESRVGGGLDDVVACIYLGYMPRTNCSVHVHVYRFDEPATAATFVELVSLIVADNARRIDEVELGLAERGEIDDPRLDFDPAPDSATGSVSSAEDETRTSGSDEVEADLQSLNEVRPFDSVAEELKHRLRVHDRPLLLPPKDYDTISRARGNLKDINERRCMNLHIVGEAALVAPSGSPSQQRRSARSGSGGESGVDLPSPSSDVSDSTTPFAQQTPTGVTSVSSPPASSSSSQPAEASFIYPPRPTPLSPRTSIRSGNSRFSDPPVVHVRQSSASSVLSTHSSRASQHSDGSGGGADNIIVYRGGADLPGSAGVRGRESYTSNSSQDAFLPPSDYYDGNIPNEVVAMRPKAHPPLLRANSTGMDASMLTRSMPAGLLHSEMQLSGSRRDEEFYPPRRGQSLHGSSGQVNSRRHLSSSEQNGDRRGKAPLK